MANSRSSLPVFPGDTRITAMNVPALEEEIPKGKFQELLKVEAPHFMRTLLDFEIPDSQGRFMLPIIETVGKTEAAESNVDELDAFISDNCKKIPGQAVKFTEFKEKFHDSLEDYQKPDWSTHAIKKRLSENYPVAKGAKANQVLIGNMSFDFNAKPGPAYIKEDGKLKKED
jgi:hypothetical protein